MNEAIISELNRIIAKDSLDELSSEEKDKLWEYRYKIYTSPKALPKFLLSFNWRHADKVEEAIR